MMPAAAVGSEEPATRPHGLVAQYFRIWNGADPAQLKALLAPTWVDHAHPDRHTVDEVVRSVTDARASQPDLRFYVDAILGDGELVTVHGRECTPAATKNWVWIIRVQERRLQEIWTYSAD